MLAPSSKEQQRQQRQQKLLENAKERKKDEINTNNFPGLFDGNVSWALSFANDILCSQ